MPTPKGISNFKYPISNTKLESKSKKGICLGQQPKRQRPHGSKYLSFVICNLSFPAQRRGFTLVELLVVLGLLSITVVSTLMFLTSTLKGSNQATIITEVKQNGQIVLDLLEREIRGSNNASKVTGEHIILTRATGDPMHIKCFHDKETKEVKQSNDRNGWIGTAVSTQPNPGETLFTPITGGAITASTSETQKASYLVSGMDVTNCAFDVKDGSQGGANPAIVSISFTVNQAVEAPSRPNFEANAKFQTTISLRGIN